METPGIHGRPRGEKPRLRRQDRVFAQIGRQEATARRGELANSQPNRGTMEELALARLQTRGTAGRHTAGHRTKRG